MGDIISHQRNANQNYMSYHFTPIMVAIKKKKKPGKNKCWRERGKIGTLINYRWECKMVQLHWKTVWQVCKKSNIELLYDPAIPLLGIYQRFLN